MRELVCSKLNLGLEVRYTGEPDERLRDVQLSRAQYKGYAKVLKACIAGLEASFHTPGSNGLASAFHVLEIAHTHFGRVQRTTPPPSRPLPSTGAGFHRRRVLPRPPPAGSRRATGRGRSPAKVLRQ